MPTVSAIALIEGKNPNGWKKMWLAPRVDVSAIPAASAGDVASAITMVTSKVFFPIPIDPEGETFWTTEEPESPGGTGDVLTLNAFIAGDSAARRAALDTWDGVYCIAIGQRKDGVYEIIGDVDTGIRMRRSKVDAGAPGNPSGYNLVGTIEVNHLPYTYSDGTIAV